MSFLFWRHLLSQTYIILVPVLLHQVADLMSIFGVMHILIKGQGFISICCFIAKEDTVYLGKYNPDHTSDKTHYPLRCVCRLWEILKIHMFWIRTEVCQCAAQYTILVFVEKIYPCLNQHFKKSTTLFRAFMGSTVFCAFIQDLWWILRINSFLLTSVPFFKIFKCYP